MNTLIPHRLIARANSTRNLRNRAKHTTGLILVLVGLINWITLPGYSSVRLAAHGDGSRDSTSGGRLATATSPSASIFTLSETVIDPALVYSTTGIGARAIAADSFGNAYVANGGTIVKLNSTGTALVYSTFLGDGTASAIAVDPAGNAYVTGSTSSPNFPTTPGVVPTTYGGNGDAFVAKLDADGRLIYSTYLGGSHNDDGRAIAVDSVGNAYVMGLTDSLDSSSTPDAFVTTLNETGSAVVSSYRIPTPDGMGGFAVDASGNAYMTGFLDFNFPNNFPTTPGAFNTSGSLFISKINAQGIVYAAIGPELTTDDVISKNLLYQMAVRIEITPGCPDWTIAPGRRGEFSVALFGSDDLDVHDVEASSLRFHGATAVRTELSDINGDGKLDLVVVFDQASARLNAQARTARLTGWLKNSQVFIGQDRINVVPY